MRVFRRIMLGSGIIDIDTLPDTQKLYYIATAKVTPKRGSFSSAVIANKWDDITREGIIVCSRDITTINENAFSGVSVLTSITIPDSVTTIGTLAFSECSGKITINSKIVEIDYTLDNYPSRKWLQNSKFTELILGDNIEKIGDHTFHYFTSLTSVTIPDSVTSLGYAAFGVCKNLTNIIIPNSITSIGQAAFTSCTSLTSITIPDSVTSIESSAFSYCSSLSSITIPDSVTKIRSYAFYDCSSLTSITIPNGVTKIEEYTFFRCTSMQYYDFSTHESVPSLTTINDFSSIPSTCKIIVPDAIYDEWIAATNWSAYADNIINKSDWDASQVTE